LAGGAVDAAGAGAGATLVVGAGAGAGGVDDGAVALPEPSAVAAAVAFGAVVRPARRARKRSNKPALANWVINMTAATAMRKHFRISELLFES
jgi:hypothetical protein